MDNEPIHLLLPESKWIHAGFSWCLELKPEISPLAQTTVLSHQATCPRCLKNFRAAKTEPGHPLREYSQWEGLQRSLVFSSPEVVARFCRGMVHEPQRHLECLVLNSKRKLIAQKTITVGILTDVLVHPREIFRFVITQNGHGFILVQNQPSGEAEPDAEDCKNTKNLVKCSELLQVEFYDHVFVAYDGYYSQREQTRLWL